MTGLVLKLGPRERILINGAVIENGERRSRINIVTPNANILRLRDAIHPDEVNTPVRRICYLVQLILSGDTDPDEVHSQLICGIEQLSQVLTDSDSRQLLNQATTTANERQYYQSLKSLRALLPREDRLLSGIQGR